MRVRSFQGCFTCRARKVKCDETQPICITCANADLQCEGFLPRLRWLTYDPHRHEFQGDASDLNFDDGGHGRRFLYTESQRQMMSDATIRALSRHSRGISKTLNDLDDEVLDCEDVEIFEKGPFGAFRMSKSSMQDPLVWSCDGQVEPFLEVMDSGGINLETEQDQAPAEDLDQYLWDFAALSGNPIVDIDTIPDLEPLTDVVIGEVVQSPEMFALCHSPSLHAITVEEFNPLSLPSTMKYLLRHYRSNMGNWFSPLPTRRHHPWSVLHLPIALTTVSELSIWGKASHARIVLFRALLAVSAFALTNASPSPFWSEIAQGNKAVAKAEMKLCLKEELSGPCKAKYKDILVSLLSLVSISVASGEFREVRAYLRDAERLICLRGIPKPLKSRKVRILHYIFLFLRVVEESTHIYPKSDLKIFDRVLDTDTLLFPSIQTQCHITGEDLNKMCGSDYETELLSIVPNTPSLMMEIYGIPLSLFSLISRTTSLANKLESRDNYEWGEMSSQIRTLEDEICSWNLEDAIISEANGVRESADSAPTNGKMAQELTLAIHNALVLYFYRRLYDIKPLLLQCYVDKVLKHLALAEQVRMESNVLNASIIWPGFIAAVEACGEERRLAALTWLRTNWQRSGWRSFESAANIAEELWRIRQRGNTDMSWVDLLRGRGTALVLT